MSWIKRDRFRTMRFGIGTICHCTLLLFLFACQTDEGENEPLIRPVRFQVVKAGDGERRRTYSGVAQAGMETNLSFQIGGTVESVRVKVGQRVKKGDVVAELNPEDANLRYEKALAVVENARTQRDTTKANLDRIRGLFEKRNVSLSEYESAKNQHSVSVSNYESAKRNAELERSQLRYSTLAAPMDGFIVRVNVEKNENVQTGNVIAVLNSVGDIEISVGLPEAYISRVATGDTVSVRFSALEGVTFTGTVSEVSYAIGADAPTYPVIVSLGKAPENVRPGMTAEVTFQFSVEDSGTQLVIPVNAVAEDHRGSFVYLVEPEDEIFGLIRRKDVRVGEMTAEGFVILEGLQKGDRVVTAGVNKINDGLKVRLLQ